MVVECRRQLANERSRDSAVWRGEEAFAHCLIRLRGLMVVQRVGRVRGVVCRDKGLSSSVAIVVVDWDPRTVDGGLLKVWSAVAVHLGVQVRVQSSL